MTAEIWPKTVTLRDLLREVEEGILKAEHQYEQGAKARSEKRHAKASNLMNIGHAHQERAYALAIRIGLYTSTAIAQRFEDNNVPVPKTVRTLAAIEVGLRNSR